MKISLLIACAVLSVCCFMPGNVFGSGLDNEFIGIAGYGGRIGILYKPAETLNVGFSVRSEIAIEMDGKEKMNGTKFDSEMEFTVPYYFDLGFSFPRSSVVMHTGLKTGMRGT
jgi:hypothetical protein